MIKSLSEPSSIIASKMLFVSFCIFPGFFCPSTNYTFYVLQVDEVASSLASEDVFVLETTKKTWIWKGKVSVTSFYAG
jgi:hypothetical protein